jgi:SAM-dependent methyltransferase
MQHEQEFQRELVVWSKFHQEDYLGPKDKFAEGLKTQLALEQAKSPTLAKMRLLPSIEKHFFDFLATNTGKWSILEIGCGYGLFGMAFVDLVRKYRGVDIDEGVIAAGNLALQEIGLWGKAELLRVDETGLEIFEDKSFNFIFAENSFNHIPPSVTRFYLEQCVNKLKRYGKFLFQFNLKLDGEGIHRNTTQMYTPEELDQLFAGLKLDTIEIIKDDNEFAPNQIGCHIYGRKA